jgi:hypothetical protein
MEGTVTTTATKSTRRRRADDWRDDYSELFPTPPGIKPTGIPWGRRDPADRVADDAKEIAQAAREAADAARYAAVLATQFEALTR